MRASPVCFGILLGCVALGWGGHADAAGDPRASAPPEPASTSPEPPGSAPTLLEPPAPIVSALPRALPNPLQIAAPAEVLRIDYFAQPDISSQKQAEYFNLDHRARFVANAIGPVGKTLRLGFKLEYEYSLFNRVYQDFTDKESVHAISVRPLIVYYKNRWAVIAELGPVLATTFQSDLSYRDWRLKLFTAVMYTLRPTLALRVGVFGVTGFSSNAFFSPAIGLSWRPTENLLFDFYLPLWITLYYTPFEHVTMFVRAVVDVVSFDETLQRPGQPVVRDSPVIGYPRTGVGLRLTPYRGLHTELAAGYSTEAAASFQEKNLQMNGFRSTLYIQAALVITSELFAKPRPQTH